MYILWVVLSNGHQHILSFMRLHSERARGYFITISVKCLKWRFLFSQTSFKELITGQVYLNLCLQQQQHDVPWCCNPVRYKETRICNPKYRAPRCNPVKYKEARICNPKYRVPWCNPVKYKGPWFITLGCILRAHLSFYCIRCFGLDELYSGLQTSTINSTAAVVTSWSWKDQFSQTFARKW